MLLSDDDKKKLKNHQLDILKEIDRVCKKHNITYFLAYGTLLGAVRHKGFIPWDDDIDIMMPYSELLKFEKVINDLGDSYFYQSPKTDSEYHLSINRVRKNDTLLVESYFKNKNCHKGVFVDIYPMYGADMIKRKEQVNYAMRRALYLFNTPAKNSGFVMRLGTTLLLASKSNRKKKKLVDYYFNKMNCINYSDASHVVCLDSNRRVMATEYRKECFLDVIHMPFEDILAPVPCGYDEILKHYYGDYMTLPKEEDRQFHHNYINIKI